MNRLADLLRQRMDAEGLTVRDAAQLIGISHSTVARAANGETVEVDTLVKICEFLGVPVESVLDIREDSDDILEQIVTVLSIEPELSEVFSEIAKGLTDGTVDRRVLAEVAAFAHYRLGQNRKEPAVKKSKQVAVETGENSLEE